MTDFEKIRHAFDEGKKTVSTAETDSAIQQKGQQLAKLNEEIERAKKTAIQTGANIVAEAQLKAETITTQITQIEVDMKTARNALDLQMAKVSSELAKLKESQKQTDEENRKLANARQSLEKTREEAKQAGVDIIAEAQNKATDILKRAKRAEMEGNRLKAELKHQVDKAKKATALAKHTQKQLDGQRGTLDAELFVAKQNTALQQSIKEGLQKQTADLAEVIGRISTIMLFIAEAVEPILKSVEVGQSDLSGAVKEIEESRLILLAEKQRLDAQKEFQEQRDIQLDEKSAIIKEQRVQLDTAIKEKNGK